MTAASQASIYRTSAINRPWDLTFSRSHGLVGYGAVEEFDRAFASFGIVENESFDYYGARIALTEGASIEVQHAAARRRITRAEELFVLEPKDGAGTFGTMEYADWIPKHLHAGGSILALMLRRGSEPPFVFYGEDAMRMFHIGRCDSDNGSLLRGWCDLQICNESLIFSGHFVEMMNYLNGVGGREIRALVPILREARKEKVPSRRLLDRIAETHNMLLAGDERYANSALEMFDFTKNFTGAVALVMLQAHSIGQKGGRVENTFLSRMETDYRCGIMVTNGKMKHMQSQIAEHCILGESPERSGIAGEVYAPRPTWFPDTFEELLDWGGLVKLPVREF